MVEENVTFYVACAELQTLLPGASIVETSRRESRLSPSPPGDSLEFLLNLGYANTPESHICVFIRSPSILVEESSCTWTMQQ